MYMHTYTQIHHITLLTLFQLSACDNKVQCSKALLSNHKYYSNNIIITEILHAMLCHKYNVLLYHTHYICLIVVNVYYNA